MGGFCANRSLLCSDSEQKSKTQTQNSESKMDVERAFVASRSAERTGGDDTRFTPLLIDDETMHEPAWAELDGTVARAEIKRKGCKLVACLLMMGIGAMVSWEAILKYHTSLIATMEENDFHHVPSWDFHVLAQQLPGLAVAFAKVRWVGNGMNVPYRAFIPCSAALQLATWCSSQLFLHVHFALNFFTSFKVVAVMYAGVLLLKTKYPTSLWVESSLISIAAMIASRTMWHNLEFDIWTTPMSLAFLFFSAFNLQWQEYLYRKYDQMDIWQMAVGLMLWSSVLTVLKILVSGELYVMWEFCVADPYILVLLLGMGVPALFELMLACYVLQEFGPVVLGTIILAKPLVQEIMVGEIFISEASPYTMIGVLLISCVACYQGYRIYNFPERRYLKQRQHDLVEGQTTLAALIEKICLL